MRTLALSEFRAHVSTMLDLVKDGETVRIMRHGKPVADLVPVREDAPVDAAVASYQQPFTPVMSLPEGYSAVRGLLQERDSAPW